MNAPSLHVVEGVVMACWWRIPPLAASPVDRLGFGGGETVAATKPLPEPLIPPPLYRAARRGPTSLILGWASPIRTRVKVGPVVGLARWRSILTHAFESDEIKQDLSLLSFLLSPLSSMKWSFVSFEKVCLKSLDLACSAWLLFLIRTCLNLYLLCRT